MAFILLTAAHNEVLRRMSEGAVSIESVQVRRDLLKLKLIRPKKRRGFYELTDKGRYENEANRRLFFQLFYRVQLGWLVDREDIDAKFLQRAIQALKKRAEDETLCNDNCKSLYWCERKRWHKGKHRDGGLAWD